MKVLEHATVEFDAICVAVIGYDIMPKPGSEHERVGAELPPVSRTLPSPPIRRSRTISAEQEIVAAACVERLSAIVSGNDAAAIAADIWPVASTIDWPRSMVTISRSDVH